MAHLDPLLAQEIVNRTMRIIDYNVNVMDANGTIIGSGESSRLGLRHEGAMQVIARGRAFEVDDELADRLEGARPGINLPLHLEGKIVGVIGITGKPSQVRRYGQLVQMAAEMMLEQAKLMNLLARDSRLREELVLHLIRSESDTEEINDWAQRLGVNLKQPRVVAVIEIDSGTLGVDAALAEIQQLQVLLTTPERDNLIATVSLSELVVLKPTRLPFDSRELDRHRQRVDQLLSRMRESSKLGVRLALGHYFPGAGGIARSYRTARTALQVGKQRTPSSPAFFYQDLVLPVLLDSLKGGWQADELRRSLARLVAQDGNGVLRKTLKCWFANDTQAQVTARALSIHRNTLDYRLRRAAELTDLELDRFDDRLLLYIALLLVGDETGK
jgi:carbohydrate diacid regulator